ncbi:MAG: hypothetical protein AAF810_07775 [Cyanobacteria bacterium P01_D01_bin.36]
MAAEKCGITRCGLCRFYSHEGRRGGLCSQLNVNVDSSWKACCLGDAPFPGSSESTAGIATLVMSPAKEASILPAVSEPETIPAAALFRSSLLQVSSQ